MKLSSEQIDHLLSAAALAPSGGNVQPWRVEIKNDQWIVSLDPDRSGNFTDVGEQVSVFALGMFCLNISIAGETIGLSVDCQFDEQKHSVTLRFSELNSALNTVDETLYPYISARVSNRKLSDGTLIDSDIYQQLAGVFADNAEFQLLALTDSRDKKLAAKLLGDLDAIRFHHQRSHQEMFSEFRWTTQSVEQSRDGMDVKTLELSVTDKLLLKLLGKFSFCKVVPKQLFKGIPKPAMVGCSHLCCLTIKKPVTSASFFNTGRAMQQFWLQATQQKLALQPWAILPFFLYRVEQLQGQGFTQVEIDTIQNVANQWRYLFGYDESEFPIFVFRLSAGVSEPTARSLRMHWREFTHFIEPQSAVS